MRVWTVRRTHARATRGIRGVPSNDVAHRPSHHAKSARKSCAPIRRRFAHTRRRFHPQANHRRFSRLMAHYISFRWALLLFSTVLPASLPHEASNMHTISPMRQAQGRASLRLRSRKIPQDSMMSATWRSSGFSSFPIRFALMRGTRWHFSKRRESTPSWSPATRRTPPRMLPPCFGMRGNAVRAADVDIANLSSEAYREHVGVRGGYAGR